MNQKFLDYHKELIGDEFDIFLEYLEKPLRKSIRVNLIRTSIADFKDELNAMSAEPITWCKEGFWVEGKGIGATIPHQMGYYYIQEAASMLPPLVLDPQKEDIILDMSAAPGSKSTQIAPLCNTLIANDPDYERRKALVANLERCGIMNAVVTHYDGMRFPYAEFDRVLVDAPCSNVGSARKSYKVTKTWTPGFAMNISGLQKGLARKGFEMLKPGGTMVYSTCTSSLEENEMVVKYVLDNYPEASLEKIKINIKSRPGQLEGTEKCMRIYPWDNDTEFFFVSKIKKNS